MALGLRELAKSPELQASLRAEIAAQAENIAYDSMPLLNAFIKVCGWKEPIERVFNIYVFFEETLRMYPIVPIYDRTAVRDVILPLSDRIKTSTGEQISQICIQKGQIVSVAIASFQRYGCLSEMAQLLHIPRLQSRWGEDADEFKPSRWINGPTYRRGGEALGPYANL